jgi:hypothetical protein
VYLAFYRGKCITTQKYKYMKKRNLLLVGYALAMMLWSGAAFGQQGVLLSENQEHEHGPSCACGHDHSGDGLHTQVFSSPATPENWPHYPSRRSTQTSQVTPRRGTESNPTADPSNRDTIHGPNDVNLVFGAGESVAIKNKVTTWPAIGGALYSNSILVGSDYSKNAVVAIADMRGLATGALREIRFYQQGHGDQAGDIKPDTVNKSSFVVDITSGNYGCGVTDGTYHIDDPGKAQNQIPKMQLGLYIVSLSYDENEDPITRNVMGQATSPSVANGYAEVKASITSPYTWSTSPYELAEATDVSVAYWPFKDPDKDEYHVVIYNDHANAANKWSKDNAFVFSGATADTLYTSTKDATARDNNQPLLHVFAGKYTGSTTPYDDLLSSAQYYRPTTVLLSGTNGLDKITIGKVEWYAAYLSGTVSNTNDVLLHAINPTGCCHFSGWVSYYRDDVEFTMIQTPSSGKYVDAAVRLLDEADVSVEGNVTDNTGSHTIGTAGTGVTDAVLVLPGLNNYEGVRSNFRLKIGGDADILHTQDSSHYAGTDPLNDGYLYRDAAAGGPGALFPTTQVPIYLSSGTASYNDEVGNLADYRHPREANTLTHDGGGNKFIAMPYKSTNASVYGVKGSYFGNTDIYTRTIADLDSTNIIEIGPATENQNHFKIYSSGMLKNFRSDFHPQADSITVGFGAPTGHAPGFNLSNDSMPLYIINDGTGSGYNYNAGITFLEAGVDSINEAIKNAAGVGDLHIQANSFVHFYNKNLPLDFDVLQSGKDNEIKILSDSNGIYVEEDLKFRADAAHLTLWAKGKDHFNRRGSAVWDGSNQVGAIKIDGSVTAIYEGTKDSGLVLLRSEYDDIWIDKGLSYTNVHEGAEKGELMVQAGQDIRIGEDVTLTQQGQRSMLFEAQKTAYFGGAFTVERIAVNDLANGDLTIKAGYPNFLPTADVYAPFNWGTGSDFVGSYANREADKEADFTGGDIAFGGDVNIEVKPSLSDSVDTYIRAFNSIHIDKDFTHTLESGYSSGEYVDTTMLYAETGNIEAMTNTGRVIFNISSSDSTYLLLQAGNKLGNPYGVTLYSSPYDNWKGNILFGENKTLEINHAGVGPTLISASRDIENQTGSGFTFTYSNSNLRDKTDDLLITAGRHIETHAPYVFNYTTAGTGITSNITMQAGHQPENGNLYNLGDTTETASNLAYNGTGKNIFAQGGAGHGSILLFNPVTYDYLGQGTILMTARNGNIESDPYLDAAGAPIVFNHEGTGITRLEAIDIKLHDRLDYNGSTASDLENGRLEIFAFDSVLTRSLAYNNPEDTGSVRITANKLKRDSNNDVLSLGLYDASKGGPGINQGHIVLGYGADPDADDKIEFNFAGNPNTEGANVLIRAGYDGFANNSVTGSSNFAAGSKDAGKAYGGNITFDYIKADMATGNHTLGGYMEISTPNGNIWGKDSISFNAYDGDLLVDAGLGSLEDTLRATRWGTAFSDHAQGNGHENTLNTCVALSCGDNSDGEWRTGNIMMKGAALTFNNQAGNATFRTREGFIDTYDAFTAADMQGTLLKYAGMDDATKARGNNWGDVSERDFQYIPTTNSGSVFFGADDNIMLNYGNSNFKYDSYGKSSGMGYPGDYDVTTLNGGANPYHPSVTSAATFNVNKDGYLFYRNPQYRPNRSQHLLYRGCDAADYSGITGECKTTSNGARDLTFDYRNINTGGIAAVASNYIDLFTKFDYFGGQGSGLHAVPGKGNLHGEAVAGYGLYIKSQFNGEGNNLPEKRRATCEGCGEARAFSMGGVTSKAIPEMTYIGFHDDARIHTHRQKSLLEAPVIEIFGHAEMDTETDKGVNTNITLKGDSLIFHDSVIFAGDNLDLVPFTTDVDQRANDMRYGVINDRGPGSENYSFYGPAIEMEDRGLPVLELGYQRCSEPGNTPNNAPNYRSVNHLESTPRVGGDVVVAFKHGYSLPIFNTVVANNSRISFVSDMAGGDYVDAFVRTDLLRIRNKVEFYTDPQHPLERKGKFVLATQIQMDGQKRDAGMYTRHLHTEPGSELSIPGEDSLIVISSTVVGGYGNIHENVFVKGNGILAPGFASLMEEDCQTGANQGTLTVHNLQMEKDAVLRVSVGSRSSIIDGEPVHTTLTDMIHVEGSIFTFGKIPVVVLCEMQTLEAGCYQFMTYGDTEGVSREYVKNFVLDQKRYGDFYFALDYESEPGKVNLCVTTFPTPDIQRSVDLPLVTGVTTNPAAGRHYVSGHKDFSFTAAFTGTPLKVTAEGFYSHSTIDLDNTAKSLGGNVYEYTIRQVVEPWTVFIGPGVGNDDVPDRRVWAYRDVLYINSDKADVVSIYNMTGVLNKKMDIPEGMSKFTLERGIYVVTLKDGSVYRIIIN